MIDEEWNKLDAVEARLRPVISAIVERHRTRGDLLTWRLLHEIEDEAFQILRQAKDIDELYIRMMQSSPVFQNRRSDEPVDFKGSNAMPAAFWMIQESFTKAH